MRHPTRGLARHTRLLLTLVLLFTAISAFAAAIGDQVALHARIRAGVPLPQEPRGTHDFQCIPDGTRATVIEVAQDGRWLKVSLPDDRTGWVASSYVTTLTPGTSSTGTSPTGTKPQRIEEGTVTPVADCDTLTVITPTQAKLRIRMFGIDAPEIPKGTKFPGQPYGTEAETYLKQLVEGKRVMVLSAGVDHGTHRDGAGPREPLAGMAHATAWSDRSMNSHGGHRGMVPSGAIAPLHPFK